MNDSHLAGWGTALGVFACAAILSIYYIEALFARARNLGHDTPVKIDRCFDPDDLLYLVGPIAWAGLLPGFLIAAVVRAPVYALWTLRRYRGFRIAAPPGERPASHLPTGVGEVSVYSEGVGDPGRG